jgi:hypothetical protein
VLVLMPRGTCAGYVESGRIFFLPVADPTLFVLQHCLGLIVAYRRMAARQTSDQIHPIADDVPGFNPRATP